ncbi:MAG: hypothetical protein HKO95_03255 [Rhodobacteraceae bacterium]|jgi:hypothetical protein|nr:hypothetical protein [Alphaproteobacteria bacterium]NNF73326.1 hypothetical protein [Paracoccaceae bacterium]NNK65735.1 hypothetical protein [Paracoccaceae bacterium]
MKQAVFLLILIAGTFVALDLTLGYQLAYSIAFGTISVMAMMISLTFFWLWMRRETPLALGMSFSWAGAASVLGWWWLFHVLHQPVIMRESAYLFAFLALYVVGAVLHFTVMHRSMGVSLALFAMPILGAIGIAAFVATGL